CAGCSATRRCSRSGPRTARTASPSSTAARSWTAGASPDRAVYERERGVPSHRALRRGSPFRVTQRMKVLVTGASGFICGYLVADLLNGGHEVVGVDNFSKYGPVRRSFDTDPRYRLVEGDAKDAPLLPELAAGCHQRVA